MLASLASDVFLHAAQQLNTAVPFWTETLERAEAQRTAALAAIGKTIRALDLLAIDLADGPVAETDLGLELAARMRQDRERLLNALRAHCPDEAHYWSPEWQEGEREVEAEARAGLGDVYLDDDAFDAALRDRRANV